MDKKWLKFSTNQSSVKLDLKKKNYLKVEMCPVNALRLEWCYDTGNDKNVTIIRLSRGRASLWPEASQSHIMVCPVGQP